MKRYKESDVCHYNHGRDCFRREMFYKEFNLIKDPLDKVSYMQRTLIKERDQDGFYKCIYCGKYPAFSLSQCTVCGMYFKGLSKPPIWPRISPDYECYRCE